MLKRLEYLHPLAPSIFRLQNTLVVVLNIWSAFTEILQLTFAPEEELKILLRSFEDEFHDLCDEWCEPLLPDLRLAGKTSAIGCPNEFRSFRDISPW